MSEPVSNADELDRLRAELAQRTAEVAKANAERDAARQSSEPKKFTPEWGARLFGWDCFAPHTNATDVSVQNGGA